MFVGCCVFRQFFISFLVKCLMYFEQVTFPLLHLLLFLFIINSGRVFARANDTSHSRSETVRDDWPNKRNLMKSTEIDFVQGRGCRFRWRHRREGERTVLAQHQHLMVFDLALPPTTRHSNNRCQIRMLHTIYGDGTDDSGRRKERKNWFYSF